MGGSEESKGSNRGSIAPGYYSCNIPLQRLGARRSIGWEVVNKVETGVVQRQGGQESRKSVPTKDSSVLTANDGLLAAAN